MATTGNWIGEFAGEWLGSAEVDPNAMHGRARGFSSAFGDLSAASSTAGVWVTGGWNVPRQTSANVLAERIRLGIVAVKKERRKAAKIRKSSPIAVEIDRSDAALRREIAWLQGEYDRIVAEIRKNGIFLQSAAITAAAKKEIDRIRQQDDEIVMLLLAA